MLLVSKFLSSACSMQGPQLSKVHLPCAARASCRSNTEAGNHKNQDTSQHTTDRRTQTNTDRHRRFYRRLVLPHSRHTLLQHNKRFCNMRSRPITFVTNIHNTEHGTKQANKERIMILDASILQLLIHVQQIDSQQCVVHAPVNGQSGF